MIKTIPRRRIYFAPGAMGLVARGAGAGGRRKLEGLIAGRGFKNPLATVSGRAGLRLLLETSGMPPGREVLVPAYTFGMVYPAIAASGFVPVAVDIAPETFQISPEAARRALTVKTGAVLATHIFGEPCDILELEKLARASGLALIEDCAQAFGATLNGRPAGTFGDAGFISLDKSKPLQGIQGGVIFGNDAEWLGRARERAESAGPPESASRLKFAAAAVEDFAVGSPAWRAAMLLFGYEGARRAIVSAYRRKEGAKTAPEEARAAGSPLMPDLFAELAAMNMEGLDARLARRRKIRDIYREVIGGTLKFQRTAPGAEGSCHMAVALADGDIGKLRLRLALRGVDVAAGDEIADDCLKAPGSNVAAVFSRAITLPMSDRISETDALRAARAVKETASRAD
ncbi:MAG TPA: aminotransferase class I/II-fold pyridoxal phosphate-dependent enzyme [bacterium]|nr:aminotransferase class I/II-fold pyridoxal phosphate-dependent enzyme [bacterium]